MDMVPLFSEEVNTILRISIGNEPQPGILFHPTVKESLDMLRERIPF